jgi:hypothetical protein
MNGSTNLVKNQKTAGSSKSLESRIEDHKSNNHPYCEHCKCTGHWMSKCHKFADNKCKNCGKIGHKVADCWSKKKKKEKKDKDKGKGKKNEDKRGEEDTNTMVDNELIAIGETYNVMDNVNEVEMYNFDTYHASNAINEHLMLYDWLADSATTSHVTHQCEAFISYTPMGDATITGVGGKATIAGRGTIELILTCNGQKYLLTLENVLHVPETKNNLISLG